MEKLLFSIIVPVYNAEQYLSRTMDSLYQQGLEEDCYEIILVNDGSKDLSLDICEHYHKKHSNITILTQDNQGVSAARNKGLSLAKGEFICFVDSDDTLSPNSLSYLTKNYNIQNYDAVRFWTKLVYNNETESTDPTGEVKFTGTGLEYIKEYGLETFCYTFIYKKKFLVQNHLEFKPLVLGEDYLFASSVLLANPYILSTSCRMYNYIIRQGSATTTRSTDHVKKVIDSQIKANEELWQKMQKLNLKNTNSIVFDKALQSMREKIYIIFSRLLSVSISHNETIKYLERCKKIKTIPLPLPLSNFRKLILNLVVNLLFLFPILIVPLSFLYKNVFLQYVYKNLDRNN